MDNKKIIILGCGLVGIIIMIILFFCFDNNGFENSNKATYGKVLNFAGSDYMPGAAYLSSVAALKVGCGYCFLCSTGRVIDAVAAQTQNVVFAPLYKRNEYN